MCSSLMLSVNHTHTASATRDHPLRRLLCALLICFQQTTPSGAWLQNSPYWEITAGFIGSVKATVPITTLSTDSCQATLDEILITIKPKSLHHPSVHGTTASTNLSGSNMFAPDIEDQTAAQDIMTDGIMQIAGGLETLMQQLQLQVMSWSVMTLLLMLHLHAPNFVGTSIH